MQIIHNVVKKDTALLPDEIISVLPAELLRHINSLALRGAIEEIRLRADKFSSLVLRGENYILPFSMSKNELQEILKRMCGGSLYAFSETINKGYVSLPNGIRVGVAGRASTESGKIIGVYDISSLCIRIPHKILSVGQEICTLLSRLDYRGGVLIYSPPGVGKTTVLRGVIRLLSSGETPKRVVVVDSRGELAFDLGDKNMCVDVLSGYPRGEGIEIAARVLNPELIVCDEIGDVDEALELVASSNCGIPLLATAHAGTVSELLSRTGIRLLYEAGVFGAYVKISRASNMNFSYDITFSKNLGGAYDL